MPQIPEACLVSYENLCTETDKSLEVSKKDLIIEQGLPTFFSQKYQSHDYGIKGCYGQI